MEKLGDERCVFNSTVKWMTRRFVFIMYYGSATVNHDASINLYDAQKTIASLQIHFTDIYIYIYCFCFSSLSSCRLPCPARGHKNSSTPSPSPGTWSLFSNTSVDPSLAHVDLSLRPVEASLPACTQRTSSQLNSTIQSSHSTQASG